MKYIWEDDKTHSGYAYNDASSWKGTQLSFLTDFIKRKFTLPQTSMKILDVGCNAALNIKRFLAEFPREGNECFGFDINDTSLKLAIANVPTGHFIKCNFATENPFKDYPDNYFDICFATWVLTHVPVCEGREIVVREIFRVSRRGIIIEPRKNKYIENSIVELADPQDKTNVVVLDDYTRYVDFVKKEPKGSIEFVYHWEK